MSFDSAESDEYEELNRLFLDVAESFFLTQGDIRHATMLVRKELQRRPWKRCRIFSGIDFNDISKCCGYLKRYAVCHCALARYSTGQFFSKIRWTDVEELLSKDELKVVSAGGGPGNDLLGFCSAVASDFRTRFRAMYLTVIDLKAGWAEVFFRIYTSVLEGRYGLVSKLFKSVEVASEFLAADLSSYAASDRVNSADIILMTKVLSVVSDKQKTSILQNIFSAMKDDAIFLFTDIDADIVLRNAHGMTVLYHSGRRSFHLRGFGRHSLSRSTFEIIAVQKRQNVIYRDMFYYESDPYETANDEDTEDASSSEDESGDSDDGESHEGDSSDDESHDESSGDEVGEDESDDYDDGASDEDESDDFDDRASDEDESDDYDDGASDEDESDDYDDSASDEDEASDVEESSESSCNNERRESSDVDYPYDVLRDNHDYVAECRAYDCSDSDYDDQWYDAE